MSAEINRKEQQLHKLTAEKQSLNRMLRDSDLQLARATRDAKNAIRIMNERVGAALIKLNASTAVTRFIIPRLGGLQTYVETRNGCMICYKHSNIQLGNLLDGCGHKMCYTCLVNSLDFSNNANNGCCPYCSAPIVCIEDVEYNMEDDIEHQPVIQPEREMFNGQGIDNDIIEL